MLLGASDQILLTETRAQVSDGEKRNLHVDPGLDYILVSPTACFLAHVWTLSQIWVTSVQVLRYPDNKQTNGIKTRYMLLNMWLLLCSTAPLIIPLFYKIVVVFLWSDKFWFHCSCRFLLLTDYKTAQLRVGGKSQGLGNRLQCEQSQKALC